MKDDLPIKNGIIIPGHELDIKASRASGPGGQHVNKSNTRISVRWNIQESHALDDMQKRHVLKKLESELTNEGELIVHNSSSRSQAQNKKAALEVLAHKVAHALYVPKRRMKTRTPKGVKESRLKEKKQRSEVKKMRSKKIDY